MENTLRDLLVLTKDKQRKLRQILDISRAQTTLLQEENVEGYEEQIERRQQVMDQVDQLDAGILELEKRLRSEHGKDLSSLAQADETQRILELRACIGEVIRAALEVEHDNSELSQRLLEKFRQEMQHHQRANHAAKAYIRSNQDGEAQSIYTNRKV